MKLHLPKMLFAAVMACFGMVQAATLSSISEKLPITINLNFDSGRGAVPQDTTKITVAGVTTTGDQWINLTGGNGTDIAVTDTAGKTYKLTFSSSGTWAASGTADALNINKGYLDMANWAGGKGISITLTNEDGTAIAWNQVNILMTGDGGSYGGINVNGTNYYYVGTTLTEGNNAWGSRTGAATYTEGTNLMVLKPGSVASADGLVLTTAGGGNARATMGGLQVVTGYGESQITGYKISDFSEGETATLAALAAGADLTKLPLTIEVTATAATDDVAMLGLDAPLNEVIVKGGALGMDVTTDTTVGTIAFEDGGNIGALNIAAGKTLTVTGPVAGITATTSGTGKLVIGMVNNKEASGKGVLNFGDDCKFESVRISGGVIATNLNSTARSSNIGSADLVMAGGTTYVIRNGNGTGGSITTGDILLEGAMDLMVYGSTHDSVISNDIKEASEDADTYIRKTDGGTTTLTGEVTVDSVRVAAGTLVLGEGNVTTTGQIRLSENGSNGNKLVINGATLKVTGTTNAHSTGDSIVLAHWGQTGFLEVNAGTLDATGAVALLSWTGTGTMNLNGGTTKLLGVNFWGQQGLKGTINLGSATEGDAVLELGGTGFHEFGAGATVNLGNGTIKLAEDSVIDYNADGNAGSLNLVGTNGGTKFDTNGHTFTIGVRHNSHTTAANINLTGGGDMTKIGAGTLVVNGNVEAGLITVEEGTLKLNGTTFISQTIVNNGTLATDGGSLVITSMDGLDGEAVYSDKLDKASGNGYLSDALFAVIKADEGKTSTLEGITKVSIGGQEYDLDVTETGATVAISQGEDAGGVYFVNKGTVDYGAATNSAASDATTGIALTGGDLRVSTALKDGVTITATQDATLDIADGVSVNKDQVTGDGAITLAGAGAFGIGSATALPTGVTIGSDWTGTVVVDGYRFAGDDGKLANLANSNSFVGLTNCTGWLTPGGTVSGNIELLKGEALSLTDGSSGRTQTFSGKIKGEGDFLINMVGKGCSNITYVFSGDVSEWTGSFQTLAPSAKTFALQFTGSGDINAAVTNTNGIILNMVVGGAGDRTMNGAIKNDGGTLNLTVNGAGHKTFTKDITVNLLTVASGTGVTAGGKTTTGQLAASGTITNTGTLTVTGGLSGTIITSGLEIAVDKSTIVKSDGTTASTDGNGYMTGGFYYVVHSTDGGTLAIDNALVTDNYRLDGNNLLYTAAGGDTTTYYINNSTVYATSDAALVGDGIIQVMAGAVLSVDNNGVAGAVTLSTKGSGTVLMTGAGDWNVGLNLGADKKQIGNLKADAGVNPVLSFADAEAFKNAGTNIVLADDSLFKVSVAAGQTKGMAAFNNVKGGTIIIDPNSGSGNLVLDGTTTYNGNVEFLLKQYIIVDGALFTGVDGKYADVKITQSASGKAFTLTNREVGKENALHIGCLSGDGKISGAYGNNNAKRYIAIHQDKDTTYSGVNEVSSGDRGVGFLKYGEGTLTLTGANTSASELEIHEGAVVLKEAGAWAGDVMVADGATLDMSEAATKSLTKLTVHGGATLNAGGEAIALGSLALEGVGGGKLLTLAGIDPEAKSTVLFTGLTVETAITGIEFETILGQTVADASKYISGVGEEARLILSGNTLSLVSKLSTDFYWKGDDTWDLTSTDWSSEAEATTADLAYDKDATANFVGVSGAITINGGIEAAGVVVKGSNGLTLSALDEGNSLAINTGGLEVDNSSLTLSGAITLNGPVTMGDAASLTLATNDPVTLGELTFSGNTISHTGETEKVSATSANFTVTGGSLTSSAASLSAQMDGVALTTTKDTTLNGTQNLNSLTTGTTTATIAGTTTIGTDTLSGNARVSTGAGSFGLGSDTTTVTNGSVATDAGTINATLSGVALTTTKDTTLNGNQNLKSLTTGTTSTATIAGTTTIGTDTLSGNAKVGTGAGSFDLGSATTTVTNGSVTTDAATISATLTGVDLTTTADTTITGTQKLTGLTAGGTVTINGTVDATTVHGDLTLGGTGTLKTGDLSLAGDSSIGTLTAGSLTMQNGASLKASNLNLTSTTVAVEGLSGIGASKHLLDVTESLNKTSVMFGIGIDQLKAATFDEQNVLELASITGLTGATFEGGATTLLDEATKREYKLSVNEGIVSVLYTSSGTGWTSDKGEWKDGKSEFESVVTTTSDAAFLGDGSANVEVIGDKTVASLIVDVQPNTDVDAYTFTGSAINTGSLMVNNGTLTVENTVTSSGETEINDSGVLDIASGGTLTTDTLVFANEGNGTLTIAKNGTVKAGTATGTITNNGSLTIGDQSSVTLKGDGALTTSGETSLSMGEGASISVLTNTGTITALGETVTLTADTTQGGNLILGTGTLETRGNAAFTKLDANYVDNGGNLTVGDGTSIGNLSGGDLTVNGVAEIYTVETALGTLSGTGSLTIVEDAPLKLAQASEGSVDLTTRVLDVTPSGATSFAFGNLAVEEVIFGNDNFVTMARSIGSLLELEGVVTSDSLVFDMADPGTLGAGTYNLLEQAADIDLGKFSISEATQRAYINQGMYAILQTEGNLLQLLIAEDGNRTWDTSLNGVEIAGVYDALTLEGPGVYTSLDQVYNINVNGDNTIDLTGDSLENATDPEVGLTVRNLTGEAGKTLTIQGTHADLVSIINTKDTSGEETLALKGLAAVVTAEDGHSLHVGEVVVDDALLAVAPEATLTVGALNGTSGLLYGTVGVTGNGGSYTGGYVDATVVMKGGKQTLAAGRGLTVAGSSGTATLEVAAGSQVDRIATTGATVVLDNDGVNTLTLGDTSSMHGGSLVAGVKAKSISDNLGKPSKAPTATTGAALHLNGVAVTLKLEDKESLGSMALPDAELQKDIVITKINDVKGSTVTNSTVRFEDGEILDKYFTNIHLKKGSIEVVGDRQTDYYGTKFSNVSANGETGLHIAGNAISYLDPQHNRETHPDLANVLDALDACVANRDAKGADELSAALAGASVTTLGMVQSADMDRQLRSIRNRVITMGAVAQSISLDDQPRSHAWMNAEGDFSRLAQDGTAAGYTHNSWGGTVGFDYDFSTNFTAGVAITGMTGEFTARGPEASTHGEATNYYVTAFGRYATGAWVHSLIFTANRSDLSLDRTVTTDYGSYKTTGETSGLSFGAMYEVGYTVPVGDDGDACWQPVFNVAYKHISVNGYSESGSDAALKVDDQTMDSVVLGLGLRAQFAIGETMFNRTSVLELRAMAKAELGDRTSSADVSVVGLPSYTGTVESAEQAAFGAEVGAGLMVPVGVENGTLIFDVSSEIRGKAYSINGVVGYRLTF